MAYQTYNLALAELTCTILINELRKKLNSAQPSLTGAEFFSTHVLHHPHFAPPVLHGKGTKNEKIMIQGFAISDNFRFFFFFFFNIFLFPGIPLCLDIINSKFSDQSVCHTKENLNQAYFQNILIFTAVLGFVKINISSC